MNAYFCNLEGVIYILGFQREGWRTGFLCPSSLQSCERRIHPLAKKALLIEVAEKCIL